MNNDSDQREIHSGLAIRSFAWQRKAEGPAKQLLTAEELFRLTTTALQMGDLASSRVGLLEAGGFANELPVLWPSDLHADPAGLLVQFPGCEQPGGGIVRPRAGRVGAWAAPALQRQAMLDGPLVYSGRSPRLERQVSSVLMGVLSVIRAAGLGELGISPGSVRLTAARQVYDAAESHKIERAAEFLGIDNFETVARCLHLN